MAVLATRNPLKTAKSLVGPSPSCARSRLVLSRNARVRRRHRAPGPAARRAPRMSSVPAETMAKSSRTTSAACNARAIRSLALHCHRARPTAAKFLNSRDAPPRSAVRAARRHARRRAHPSRWSMAKLTSPPANRLRSRSATAQARLTRVAAMGQRLAAGASPSRSRARPARAPRAQTHAARAPTVRAHSPAVPKAPTPRRCARRPRRRARARAPSTAARSVVRSKSAPASARTVTSRPRSRARCRSASLTESSARPHLARSRVGATPASPRGPAAAYRAKGKLSRPDSAQAWSRALRRRARLSRLATATTASRPPSLAPRAALRTALRSPCP